MVATKANARSSLVLSALAIIVSMTPSEQASQGLRPRALGPGRGPHGEKGHVGHLLHFFPVAYSVQNENGPLGTVGPKGRQSHGPEFLERHPCPPVLPQGTPDQSDKTLFRRHERCQGDSPSLNEGQGSVVGAW